MTEASEQPKFRYVEEWVRHEMSKALGGPRGMLEGALPFVGFTVAWVIGQQLIPAIIAAVAIAGVLAVIRLVQRQPIRYVLQAVVPTVVAVVVAARTGRAEDAFVPGILYNGALAAVAIITIAVGRPLFGFVIGAALGDPTGWAADRGLVKMMSKLTAVMAISYTIRVVVQLPLFLTHQVLLLGIAKVVLGWPLLIAALAVIGVMLSRGRTPIEESSLARARPTDEPAADEPTATEPR
ncbi:DUF3159 domain-containing protein [Microlunatus speluncae]|uniref:DUF3159 domain-containing protein n=1 Tax=Microlunatus speluncae TaxID=2594267 RepID=UPI0012661F55|nr:DUF3159 domain-containing protein [Microlunatus speluncae]